MTDFVPIPFVWASFLAGLAFFDDLIIAWPDGRLGPFFAFSFDLTIKGNVLFLSLAFRYDFRSSPSGVELISLFSENP